MFTCWRLIFCVFYLMAVSVVQASAAEFNKPLTVSVANLAHAQTDPALNTFSFNQQQEWSLKAQELQLEQQLLQVKQKLFQLHQQDWQQKPAQAGFNLKWITITNSKIPADAFIAAYVDSKPVYICHADYLQGVHPGQLTDKGCMITYGGRSFIQSTYQILTGQDAVVWKSSNAVLRFPIFPRPILIGVPQPHYPEGIASDNDLPVPGGYENDRVLYICRAIFNNRIHIGKVVADHCNIAEQSIEIPVSTYEVLFVKGLN